MIGKHKSEDIESIIRDVMPGYDLFYGEIKYEYDPAFFGRRPTTSQSLPYCEINEEGFRVRKAMSWQGPDRCVLAGDSVTFGVGILDTGDLLSSQIEKVSSRPVLDLSTRAYRVQQQYHVIGNYLSTRPGPIKNLILWGGFCDILWWVLSGGCFFGNFGIPDPHPVQRTFRMRVQNSLRRRLRLEPGKDQKVFYWKNPSWKITSLAEFVNLLAGQISCIHALCRGYGITFSFLIQPMQLEPEKHSHPSTREYCLNRSQWIKETLKGEYQGFEDVAQKFRTLLMNKLAELNVPYLDCQSLVVPDDFYDQVHLKPQAFPKIAKIISQSHL